MFLAVGTGTFATVADAGSTMVALPTIASVFGTDLPTTQWVVIAYSLTISALLVPMGRLSDLWGRKRIYVAGFVVFSAGAAAAALSTSIVLLVLCRVLMGIGAAMTLGPSMAMVISAFPSEERARALGFQMSAVGTGSVAGPALGGIIVTSLGWRAIFVLTAAFGLVTIVTAALILRSTPREKGISPRFDWLGAVLSALLLVVFLLAMSNGPKVGWTSPPIVLALAGAAVLLAAFLWWEHRATAPLFDLRFFKKRDFSIGVIARFMTFVGVSAAAYLLPFYVQSVLGASARRYGLMAIPAAACTIVVPPISGRLADRYGWKRPIVGGLLVFAAALVLLSTLTARSTAVFLIFAWVVQRTGHGLFTAPNNSSVHCLSG